MNWIYVVAAAWAAVGAWLAVRLLPQAAATGAAFVWITVALYAGTGALQIYRGNYAAGGLWLSYAVANVFAVAAVVR